MNENKDNLTKYINIVSVFFYRISKAMLAVLVFIIFIDIISRNLNIYSISWPIPTAEYTLLYITFLSIPYITQRKGHITVQFIRIILPDKIKLFLEKLVYIACILISFYLGLVATKLTFISFIEKSYQYKTFDMPDWLIYLPIAIGLIMSAFEWLILLINKDSIY